MNSLVLDYEADRISEADLMRELWVERADLLVALGEYYGSMELTRQFLIDLVTAQSNGIIGVVEGKPIFFDPSRYLDSNGEVSLASAQDYNTAVRANQVLESLYYEMKDRCDGIVCPQPVTNRCCKCNPLCDCIATSRAGARCTMSTSGNCTHGSTNCLSNE